MHDAATIRELVAYDAATGGLTWRRRPRSYFATDHAWKGFNNRFVGKACGASDGCGYLEAHVYGHRIKAHIIAWVVMTGTPPCGEIDHINGVRSDNRWCNLRDVSHADNQKNFPVFKNNTSGYPGVHLRDRDSRWVARLVSSGRERFLGSFATFELARAARREAEKLYGHEVRQ